VDPKHREWLAAVEAAVGLGDLNPYPYWGLDDLQKKVAAKLQNAFYITADVRKIDGQEYFHFGKCEILSGFSLDGFIECLNKGSAYVEFDARTGHNHGTKFRIKQSSIPSLYAHHEVVFDNLNRK
jgi:hypothetical protein